MSHQSVYVGVGLLFIATTVAVFAAPPGWPWFAYHPFAMMFAFFPRNHRCSASLPSSLQRLCATRVHSQLYLLTHSLSLALTHCHSRPHSLDTSDVAAVGAVAGNAILFKKAGGYRATKIHGCLMGCCLLLALFGW